MSNYALVVYAGGIVDLAFATDFVAISKKFAAGGLILGKGQPVQILNTYNTGMKTNADIQMNSDMELAVIQNYLEELGDRPADMAISHIC
ncbi:hypothetical protein V8E54_011513 [Elaphomyces granulatus]